MLEGKVEAKAIRVPVVNVSAIDLVVSLRRPVGMAEVSALLQGALQAAAVPAGLPSRRSHMRRSISITAFTVHH